MERTVGGDGVALRPNNSLASVPGPATLVSGGNGCELRVPLSCAFAPPYTHVRTAHKASAAFVTASGATLMTTDPGAPPGATISARSPRRGLVQQDFDDFQKAGPAGGIGADFTFPLCKSAADLETPRLQGRRADVTRQVFFPAELALHGESFLAQRLARLHNRDPGVGEPGRFFSAPCVPAHSRLRHRSVRPPRRD